MESSKHGRTTIYLPKGDEVMNDRASVGAKRRFAQKHLISVRARQASPNEFPTRFQLNSLILQQKSLIAPDKQAAEN